MDTFRIAPAGSAIDFLTGPLRPAKKEAKPQSTALQLQVAAFTTVLNLLPIGIILLARTRRIVFMNQSVQHLLGDSLISHNQHLIAILGIKTLQLNQRINSVLGIHPKPMSEQTPLLIARSPMHPSLLLRVISVQSQNTECYPDAAHVMLLFNNPEQPPVVSAELLQTLYGFTPAETRLAVLFTQGLTLSEIAEQLGITQGTARNHLKAIYQKTNTHRQSQLIMQLHALGLSP